MKHLNILELHRTINAKKLRKEECFEKVLEICHKKISVAAENKKLRCVIDVPEYVVGFPIFDINECMTYIIKCLSNNGFLVKYYFPKTLYISWDYEEIKESKEGGKADAKKNAKNLEPPLQIQPPRVVPSQLLQPLVPHMPQQKYIMSSPRHESLLTSTLLARPSHAMKLKSSGKLELSF